MDEHFKWNKFYKEVVSPLYIQSEVARIMFGALREAKIELQSIGKERKGMSCYAMNMNKYIDEVEEDVTTQ